MPHRPPAPWTGRTDDEETGVPAAHLARWHHCVQPWHAQARGGVVLIGFAVDEGVRRNHGRPGAAAGPQALRQALANLPIHSSPDAPFPELWDAGDVLCQEQALENAQASLSTLVARARAQDALPLVLGGGHEVAWGTFGGLVQHGRTPGRLLILNLDAHFDLREARAPNSGTPFRQIQQWCAAHGQAFNYRVLGISRFANTQALFDRAHAAGTRWRLDEDLQTPSDWAQAHDELAADLQQCDAVYLTICLDVLSAAVAPGVSAPATLGVPLAFIERGIEQVKRSGKLIAADIAELNPAFDRDHQTARVGARLLARLAGLPG